MEPMNADRSWVHRVSETPGMPDRALSMERPKRRTGGHRVAARPSMTG